MQTHWIAELMAYDGTQLRSLFSYLQYSILGDSITSWIGPCEVSFEHMVDGEDLLAQSPIRGDKMLHFIIEIFDQKLFSAVSLQRLFASIVRDEIMIRKNIFLERSGDDLYWQSKKLSISIASSSPVSQMIHFAVNISNSGTPVETCALGDFGIEPEDFAKTVMSKFSTEFASIKIATMKVRPLS